MAIEVIEAAARQASAPRRGFDSLDEVQPFVRSGRAVKPHAVIEAGDGESLVLLAMAVG